MNLSKRIVYLLIIFISFDSKAQEFLRYIDSINFYFKNDNVNKALDCSMNFYYYSQREYDVKSKCYSDASCYVAMCLVNLKRYPEALEFARNSVYCDTSSNKYKNDSLFYLKSYYLGILSDFFGRYDEAYTNYEGALLALEHKGKINSKLYFQINNCITKILNSVDTVILFSKLKKCTEFHDKLHSSKKKYTLDVTIDSTKKYFANTSKTKINQELLYFDSLQNNWLKLIHDYGYGFVDFYDLIDIYYKKGLFFNYYGLYDSSVIQFKIADELCQQDLYYKFSTKRSAILGNLFYVYQFQMHDFINSLNVVDQKLNNYSVIDGINSTSTIQSYFEKIHILFQLGNKQEGLRNASLIEDFLIKNRKLGFKKSVFEKNDQYKFRIVEFSLFILNELAYIYSSNNLPEKAINLYHAQEDIIINNNLDDSIKYFNRYFIILRDIANCYLGLNRTTAALSTVALIENYIEDSKMTIETKSLLYLFLFDFYGFDSLKREYYYNLISNSPSTFYNSQKTYSFQLLDAMSKHCFYNNDFNCVIEKNKIIKYKKVDSLTIGYLIRLGSSKMYLNCNEGLQELASANSKIIKRYNDILLFNSTDAIKIKNRFDEDLSILSNLYHKCNYSKSLLNINYSNLLFTKFFIPRYQNYRILNSEDSTLMHICSNLQSLYDSLYLYKISNNKLSEIELQSKIDRNENFINSIRNQGSKYLNDKYDSLIYCYKNIPKQSITIEFNSFNELTKSFKKTGNNLYQFYKNDSRNNLKLISLFNENEISKYLKFNPNFIYKNKDFTSIFSNFLGVLNPSIPNVFYSPSGILHNINLGALKLDNGYYLLEKYNLHQMFSTADLTKHVNESQKGPIMLIGNVFYNSDEDSSNFQVSNSMNDNFSLLNYISSEVKVSRSRSLNWTYLPSTKLEINNIAKIYNSTNISSSIWSENKATEEMFKKLSGNSPKVIHLATHGYFFENVENTIEINDDPMFRSGLILSGANDAWIGHKIKTKEDGILTAYEVSKLDLSNTDLVVLSACETGLGDINSSEGVFGLQRAFKLAGVKYIIMSLWSVPDKETSEFMTYFYTFWLNGKTIYEAFRATQLQMISKYRDYPEKWAAFILVE